MGVLPLVNSCFYCLRRVVLARQPSASCTGVATMVILVRLYWALSQFAGLPASWRYKLRDLNRTRLGKGLQTLLTHRIFVPFLFVFFVLVWLLPIPQFYSMIDWRLYRVMNWSVVISGFMYWNLILDRRPAPPAAMRPWARVISPLLTMAPQIVAGIYITFASVDLYPIFDLCGRAIPSFDALKDQAVGGLVMWVAAGLVETFGVVYALATAVRLSAKGRIRSEVIERMRLGSPTVSSQEAGPHEKKNR